MAQVVFSLQQGFGTEMSEDGVKLGCHRNRFLGFGAQS